MVKRRLAAGGLVVLLVMLAGCVAEPPRPQPEIETAGARQRAYMPLIPSRGVFWVTDGGHARQCWRSIAAGMQSWNVVPDGESRFNMIRAGDRSDLRVNKTVIWDVSEKRLVFHPEFPGFATSDLILVGNEPDNGDASAGDGLAPWDYAHMVHDVAVYMGGYGRLVVGQTTFPHWYPPTSQFAWGSGTYYLAQVNVPWSQLYGGSLHHYYWQYSDPASFAAQGAAGVNWLAARGQRQVYLTETGALDTPAGDLARWAMIAEQVHELTSDSRIVSVAWYGTEHHLFADASSCELTAIGAIVASEFNPPPVKGAP